MAKRSSSTNRRQLLTGVGAPAATGAVGLDTILWSGPDPAYLLYLRAVRSEAAVNNFRGHGTEDACKALFDIRIATERKLAATPTTSLMDVWSRMRRLTDSQYWEPKDYYLESYLGLAVVTDLDCMVAATVPGWTRSGQNLRSRS